MSGAPGLEEARRRVLEAGGEELLERLTHLDAARGKAPRAQAAPDLAAPDRGAQPDFDVVIAGGGLSLLLAPLLAGEGLRVAVLDRARIGGAHREWNAGEAEVRALVACGLLSAEEVAALVVARYAEGVCRWHQGGSYPVRGVLDHAIDAGRLLGAARAKAEARGVTLLDGHALLGHAEGRDAVALSVEAGGAARTMVTRLLVDARGAASPYATADLVCPTVGGVLTGLAEGDGPLEIRPDVGEILATTEGLEDGRQHLWEAFPGRRGETTVYLFYYARAEDVGPGALLALYARFFATLGRYKAGEAAMARPTFGYIPGWSRLGAAPRPPGRRVRLVGDAAARHSPLTFCGFGASVRGLAQTARGIAVAVEDAGARGARCAPFDAPVHAGTGALAALMAQPPRGMGPGDMNALLDTAFAVLHGMGNDAYAALLRDEMGPADFVRFLRETAARRPRVYREVFGSLGVGAVGRWGVGMMRELVRAG